MPEAVTYRVRMPDGQAYGPAPLEQIVRWASEGRVPRNAVLTGPDGATTMAARVPQIAAALNLAAGRADAGDEGLAALVPYRNKPALIGYYLAIVGTLLAILLPAGAVVAATTGGAPPSAALVVFGGILCLLGIAAPACAIVLGVKGRRIARRDSRAHGGVHAWIAILGGAFGTLLGLVFTAGFVMFLLTSP